MNVLLDIHHHDLFRSLYYLFRGRLGFNVFIPKGLDWNRQWKYSNYPNESTIEQYLINVEQWLNVAGDLPDVRFITLDEFKDLPFDILLSSLMENAFSFYALKQKYQNNAKHIIQVGNNFPVQLIDGIGKNLLSSSTLVYQKSTIPNKVFYHQEFDLNHFYKPDSVLNLKSIYSFQHFFGTGMAPYTKDYQIFCEMKKRLSEYDFRCYGSGNEHGVIPGMPSEMAKVIREPAFVFHVKPQGDGYGYLYHNAYACGKPVIYKSEYLTNMTPMLLFDSDTSIDLSCNTLQYNCDKIKEMTTNYAEVSVRVHDKFKSTVDFQSEFFQIKKFLEKLI